MVKVRKPPSDVALYSCCSDKKSFYNERNDRKHSPQKA